MSRPAIRSSLTVFLAAALVAIGGAGCDGASVAFNPPGEPVPVPSPWTWTDLGGPGKAISDFVSNHETLVVANGMLLLGTRDGVWRRPLTGSSAWERAGLAGFAVHALALNSTGTRLIAAGFTPANDAAPTVWYSTDAALSWTAAATWPRATPGGDAFPFYYLEADPTDRDVIYGGLDADSVAVTTDGGATWIMTDGATSPNFGYPCVSLVEPAGAVLLQGCELPLDVAWVGARRIAAGDRFNLPDFRFLYGYPDFAELGNRRINSMARVPGRADRVLVGVEGGLVELTSRSGTWSTRSDIEPRWMLRREDGAGTTYPYIRAIAVLDSAGNHVLFGGTVNGLNTELSLFETTNRGVTVRRHVAPVLLQDPRVEQLWRLGATDVLLVISEMDPGHPLKEGGPHYSRVFRLRRD